jgi:hypothetical protein
VLDTTPQETASEIENVLVVIPLKHVPSVGDILLKHRVEQIAVRTTKSFYLVTGITYEMPYEDNHGNAGHWIIDLWNITKNRSDWLYPQGTESGVLLWDPTRQTSLDTVTWSLVLDK